VKQGAPAEISARTFNGVLKSAQDYSRRKLDEDRNQYDGTGIDPIYPPQIYNGLTDSIDEFSVLGFNVVPPIDTAAVPFEASSRPVFTAAIPDASKPFCITREPIPVGAIGQVVMTGPAVVRVNVTDATHTQAVPITGDKTKLTSTSAGGVPILDRESGTGVKWARVLVGGGGGDRPGAMAAWTSWPNGPFTGYSFATGSMSFGILSLSGKQLIGCNGYVQPSSSAADGEVLAALGVWDRALTGSFSTATPVYLTGIAYCRSHGATILVPIGLVCMVNLDEIASALGVAAVDCGLVYQQVVGAGGTFGLAQIWSLPVSF
jgi:hypothetical protein